MNWDVFKHSTSKPITYPRVEKIFVWPEFRITPIFTTHFCQILPEPWEILRIYAPSGYIYMKRPVTGQFIKLLLAFLLWTHLFSPYFPKFFTMTFFLDIPLIFHPPTNFSPTLNIFPHSIKIFYPPLYFFTPPP